MKIENKTLKNILLIFFLNFFRFQEFIQKKRVIIHFYIYSMSNLGNCTIIIFLFLLFYVCFVVVIS